MEFSLLYHELEDMISDVSVGRELNITPNSSAAIRETVIVDFSSKLGIVPFSSSLCEGSVLFNCRKHSNKSWSIYDEAFRSPESRGVLSSTAKSMSKIRVSGTFNDSPKGRLMIAAELDSPNMNWSASTTALFYGVLKLLSLFNKELT